MSRCLLQNAKSTPRHLSNSSFQRQLTSCLIQSRRVQGRGTLSRRPASTSAATGPNQFVRIVECGARDGLQNEPNIVDVETKLELIDRLALAGLKFIESGSMVSKKSVPQMGTTKEVLLALKKRQGVSYPVLVPNLRGMTDFLDLQNGIPIVDEVSIFTAASDSFSKANTKMSVEESLATLEKVVVLAKEKGLRVRGYVSTVITCPFEGAIKPSRVTAVSKRLLNMGCYEISLGDTVGTGTETTVRSLMEDVTRQLPVDKLAVSSPRFR
jgi:hydroxymethylglutaryl-CoA lyase